MSKYTEALQAVIEAADIRRNQWERTAAEGSPENVIDELHESGHDECLVMVDIIRGAIETVRNRQGNLIEQLQDIEQTLAENIVDAQDAAEEDGVFSPGMFTGDNDDVPICVPEDAAPELDAARTHVQDAIDYLKQEQGS